MIGERLESPRSGTSHQGGEQGECQSASERGRADERERPGEHVGPLTLTRGVKDDGRGLILYARAPGERA
jgi:hypothetical protein